MIASRVINQSTPANRAAQQYRRPYLQPGAWEMVLQIAADGGAFDYEKKKKRRIHLGKTLEITHALADDAVSLGKQLPERPTAGLQWGSGNICAIGNHRTELVKAA